MSEASARGGAVVRFLRGDYNSVRYRFVTLPLEWARYALGWRLRGKDWTEFYTHYMNRAAEADDAPPSQAYLDDGAAHLDFLKAQGLQPQHRLLDYGCGVMRTGLHAIPYLEPGNYCGVDIAASRIDKGRRMLEDAGIAPDRYRALVVSGCTFPELDGETFDYIWAQSVLTHMPIPEIRVMLRAARRLFAPGGRFYFTFSTDARPVRRNLKDFWYPESVMIAECEAAGYAIELVDFAPTEATRTACLTVPS